MAFSMFLRNPACTSKLLSQQLRLVPSSVLATRTLTRSSVASMLPHRSQVFKELDVKTTPLMESFRTFRTSAALSASMTGAADGPAEEHPHDHAKLWVIEKYSTAVMAALLPIGLLIPNKLVDALLAVLITAHSFWGLQAIVVEYIRTILFGTFIPKVAMGVVYGISVIMLAGLFYLTFNGVGVTGAFWRIWRGMNKKAPPPAKGGAHC